MISRYVLADLTIDELEWIDQRVRAFEVERKGKLGPPTIGFERFLENAGALRYQLLIELIHAELEFAVDQGLDYSIQPHIDTYPELREDPQVVAELMYKEFNLRKRRTPELTLEQFARGYPGLQEAWGSSQASNNLPSSRSVAVDSFTTVQSATGEPSIETPLQSVWPRLADYEITAFLGRGGMGVVYRAVELATQREVAIKFMQAGSLATRSELACFRREAQAIAALRHPHVLQLYRVGEYEKSPFLVLEYAESGSLKRRLSGEPYAPRAAAVLVDQLARATEAIHACGIIHRDLKPANILFTSQDMAKISDFGLARSLQRMGPGDLSQSTDMALGTPGYAAPELLFGVSSQVYPSSDVYSLGVILYELLTGRKPFVGTTVLDIVEQVRVGQIISPRILVPGIPRDLENVCLKCLARQPAQRYQTAEALSHDLTNFLQGRPVVARAIGPAQRLGRWAARNPIISASLCVIVMLMLLSTLGAMTVATWREQALIEQRRLREEAEGARQQAQQNEILALADAKAAKEALHLFEDVIATVGMHHPTVSSDEFVQDFSISARQVVQLGCEQLETRLLDRPLLRARMMTVLATTALNVGMLMEARQLISQAEAIYRQHEAIGSMDWVELAIASMRLHFLQAKYPLAIQVSQEIEQVLVELKAISGLQWARLKIHQAILAMHMRDGASVEKCYPHLLEGIAIQARQLGHKHSETVYARTVGCLCKLTIHRSVDLVSELEEIWDEVRDEPIQGWVKAFVIGELASVYMRVGQTQQASQSIVQALDLAHRSLGQASHPLLASIYADSAWIAHARGDEATFRVHQSKAIQMRLEYSDVDHDAQSLIRELINHLNSIGNFTEVEKWHRLINTPVSKEELERAHTAAQPPLEQRLVELRNQGNSMHVLADCSIRLAIDYIQRGQAELAWELFQEHCNYLDQRHLDHDLFQLWRWRTLFCWDVKKQQLIDAAMTRLIKRQHPKMQAFHPDEWNSLIDIMSFMAADPDLHESLVAWHTTWPRDRMPKHVCLAGLQLAVAKVYAHQRDWQAATKWAREAHEHYIQMLGMDCEQTAEALELSTCYRVMTIDPSVARKKER